MVKWQFQKRAERPHALWIKASNCSYSSFTERVGRDSVRAGEKQKWFRLSQHCGHREHTWLLMMPSIGLAGFLLSTVLSFEPSGSSFFLPGLCVGIFLPCSSRKSWLHHLTLEAQEIQSLSVERSTGSFLDVEPSHPAPSVLFQSTQSSYPLSRNHMSLSHLWVDFHWGSHRQ